MVISLSSSNVGYHGEESYRKMMDPIALPLPGYHPSSHPPAVSPDPPIDPSLPIDPAILEQTGDLPQVGRLATIRLYLNPMACSLSFIAAFGSTALSTNASRVSTRVLFADCHITNNSLPF